MDTGESGKGPCLRPAGGQLLRSHHLRCRKLIFLLRHSLLKVKSVKNQLHGALLLCSVLTKVVKRQKSMKRLLAAKVANHGGEAHHTANIDRYLRNEESFVTVHIFARATQLSRLDRSIPCFSTHRKRRSISFRADPAIVLIPSSRGWAVKAWRGIEGHYRICNHTNLSKFSCYNSISPTKNRA